MKRFFNKLKKTKLSTRLVYLFVVIIFIGSYSYLFKSLLLLNNIENNLRIIGLISLGIMLLFYVFGSLLLLLSKKNKTVIALSFLAMIISSFSIIASLAINRVYGLLDNMSKDKILYTTNMILKKDKEFVNDESFKVGILNNETDVEGNVLPKEYIKKNNLKINVSEYNSNFELLEKLYNGELDAIFITSNYVINYESYESYKNIENDTKIEFTYSKELKNQDIIENPTTVDKPFTVLIMGVDSTSDVLNANQAFNGDTLMLISFNPHTLNATVFSIPRDTYVPIACLKGESSKINSSAAYGSTCVINTIENLVDIKIDYYVKINFKGVVDLVNALGGINITVPEKINFCEQNSKRSKKTQDLQCIKSGYQHMDGEKALAFARHRHTLPAGDFQRVQHQQLVVEAIANSAKNLKNVDAFFKVLDSVSANIDTNMSTNQMMNLYNVGKSMLFSENLGSMINIQKTYLTGYDLTMYVNNLRASVYTFQYYEQSLEEIKHALKVTLELEKNDPVKTFNFSVNDTYQIPVIGKKYYTVKRQESIPNFKNKSIEYAKSWCQPRSISVVENHVQNTNYTDGTIINQSVRNGTLTTGISSIIFDVVKNEQD